MIVLILFMSITKGQSVDYIGWFYLKEIKKGWCNIPNVTLELDLLDYNEINFL